MNETPKGTPLGGNTSYDVGIVKIGPLVRAGHKVKNNAKHVLLGDMSRVHPDHPRCHSATWICMCRHTHDVVIYSKFHRNPFPLR